MIIDSQYLQTTSAANGNGKVVAVDGYIGAQQVEIVNVGAGTATVTFQGAFDGAGTHWYSVGYQQVDATASLSRAVAGISVAANSAHVYQLLDPYPLLRAVQSSTSGTVAVSIRVYRVG